MKRLRLDRWTGQLLVARPPATIPLRYARPGAVCVRLAPRRQQSTTTTINYSSPSDGTDHERFPPLEPLPPTATSLPSPTPDRALKSARLAALHARLSLPEKLPLQTLARTLVDVSADDNPQFNNANLAFVGQTLINYHVAEWLMVRYPRLPMSILWAAMAAYGGPAPLFQIAQSWGVKSTTTPGGEVDPGLLQFSLTRGSRNPADQKFGYERTEASREHKFRHSISSGVVMDDDYGQLILEGKTGGEQKDKMGDEDTDQTPSHMTYGDAETRRLAEQANAQFVRALVGSIYAHCGRDTVKAFIQSHVMSRTLDISKLFQFKSPLRELAMLCEREDFEPPVARLLSETGRASRTPVFVVGIFSGNDKLGEAAGPSLDAARFKAVMNALKAWYLYSPGEHVRVPSDMLSSGARPWEPAHIDVGEIISF